MLDLDTMDAMDIDEYCFDDQFETYAEGATLDSFNWVHSDEGLVDVEYMFGLSFCVKLSLLIMHVLKSRMLSRILIGDMPFISTTGPVILWGDRL